MYARSLYFHDDLKDEENICLNVTRIKDIYLKLASVHCVRKSILFFDLLLNLHLDSPLRTIASHHPPAAAIFIELEEKMHIGLKIETWE